MHAVTFDTFGKTEVIKIRQVPIPEPAADEVQIGVKAVGVNPVDWKIGEGYLRKSFPHQFPIVPGWDAAGVVTKVGADVKHLKEGDEVWAFCRKPLIQWGTYAEYVTMTGQHVVRKPHSLSFEQAAAIPLVGLTTWQGLVEMVNLGKGQKVLIHAGAGGVGSFAIQLAKHLGAEVWTTASKQNHEYCKQLGADHVIDYHTQDFTKGLEVDVVYDCVGGEVLEESYQVVSRGGWLVGIVNKPSKNADKEHGIHTGFVFVRPEGNQLSAIGELYQQRVIEPPLIEVMPIQDVAKAHESSRTHHQRGKLVLRVDFA